MSDQFVAEIRMFCGNFAPLGWATCDGQILPISQNTALFSLIGTYYGGDGRTNFALPDLAGASPLGSGNGNGLTPRTIGEQGGTPTVTLLSTEIPPHNHQFNCSTANGTDVAPTNEVLGKAGLRGRTTPIYGSTASTTMHQGSIGVAGGSLPHNNLPPYLVLTFIIALQGIYPPRS